MAEFKDNSVGSEASIFAIAVVDRLNGIFNEKWDTNNIEGAFNGVELIVNQMAEEITSGIENKQLRLSACQLAMGLEPKPSSGSQVVTNASAIEEYVKNGASKP